MVIKCYKSWNPPVFSLEFPNINMVTFSPRIHEEDPAFQACVDDACRGASEVEATSADAEDIADSDGMIDD